MRNKAISSEIFPGHSGDIYVHGYGWCDAALSAAGGLKALEFVQGPVEAALYVGLVAGELGKGVRFIRVPDKGSAEGGSFLVLLGLQLLDLGECFLVLLFVRYRSVLVDYIFKEASYVGLSLALRPLV